MLSSSFQPRFLLIQLDHAALEQLLEDGELTGLPAVTVNCTDETDPCSGSPMEDPYDAHLHVCMLPLFL
jgi:hypothetical protein